MTEAFLLQCCSCGNGKASFAPEFGRSKHKKHYCGIANYLFAQHSCSQEKREILQQLERSKGMTSSQGRNERTRKGRAEATMLGDRDEHERELMHKYSTRIYQQSTQIVNKYIASTKNFIYFQLPASCGSQDEEASSSASNCIRQAMKNQLAVVVINS